ncbi:TPA: hypothetical protein ACQZ9E_004136, partial [Klebsiella pneumoniae]
MLDFRRVVKNRKIQPEAAFCPTKNLGLEWMNSNPRMQIAIFFNALRLVIIKKASLCRVRDTRYRIPPAQIPACAI